MLWLFFSNNIIEIIVFESINTIYTYIYNNNEIEKKIFDLKILF